MGTGYHHGVYIKRDDHRPLGPIGAAIARLHTGRPDTPTTEPRPPRRPPEPQPVPIYAITGGRTRSVGRELPLESLVTVTERAGWVGRRLENEYCTILELGPPAGGAGRDRRRAQRSGDRGGRPRERPRRRRLPRRPRSTTGVRGRPPNCGHAHPVSGRAACTLRTRSIEPGPIPLMILTVAGSGRELTTRSPARSHLG